MVNMFFDEVLNIASDYSTITTQISTLKEVSFDEYKADSVSAFEEPIARETFPGLVGKLDADDSDVLATVDNVAKATTQIGALAKVLLYVTTATFGEEAVVAKVLDKLTKLPLFSVLVDLVIDDRNEDFRVESEGEQVTVYSNQTNMLGTSIFGAYEIYLDYDSPDHLYNQTIGYIENAKCRLINTLEELKETREQILLKVETDIINLAQTNVTESNVNALSEIMQIEYLSCRHYIVSFAADMYTSLNPNNEDKKYIYTIYRHNSEFGMNYRVKRSKVLKTQFIEEIDELNTLFEVQEDIWNKCVYFSEKMPPESFEEINSNFVKSYYKKHAEEAEENKGTEDSKIFDSIGKVADDDDCVYTGEIDLWK